jgi:hypothetical protein
MDDQALNGLLGVAIVVVAPLAFGILFAGLVSRAFGHTEPWFIGRPRRKDPEPSSGPPEDPDIAVDRHLIIDSPIVGHHGAGLVVSGLGVWFGIDPDGNRLSGVFRGPQSVVLVADGPLTEVVEASAVVRYEQVRGPIGPVEHALVLSDGRILSWLDARDHSSL